LSLRASSCDLSFDAYSLLLLRRRAIGLKASGASIMPTIVSGNTNAPTIKIAQKTAGMTLGKSTPQPLPVPRSYKAASLIERSAVQVVK
jgi:choline dehydrogenase-like flavoprotein